MPETKVYLYREGGDVPVNRWLEEMSKKDKKIIEKYLALIKMLKVYGHELRRPHADYLRDGIYELRFSQMHVQYRLLYFFFGRNVIVLTHGFSKEGKVPHQDIVRAIEYRMKFESDPENHTYGKGL